mmetsp:Transcript_33129/g.80460  ORF Transcript_33129/g.80460 Transcript_33129/m.80460 type:complete len:843 (+) Transcript_33129:374-2902(+)
MSSIHPVPSDTTDDTNENDYDDENPSLSKGAAEPANPKGSQNRTIIFTTLVVLLLIVVATTVGLLVGRKGDTVPSPEVTSAPTVQVKTESPDQPDPKTPAPTPPQSKESTNPPTAGSTTSPTVQATTGSPDQTSSPTDAPSTSQDSPGTDAPTVISTLTTTDGPTIIAPDVDYSVLNWKDMCSENESYVYCEGSRCNQVEHEYCRVRCRPNSCYDSIFHNSVVECLGDDSCNSNYYSTGSTDFYRSAVTCEAGSCQDANMHVCSCCDGEGCPEDIYSCTDDPIGFCASKYLQVPCSAWGNPVCAALNISEYPLESEPSKTTGVCLDGSCSDQYFENSVALCSSSSCQDSVFRESTLDCVGSGSCYRSRSDTVMLFINSTIACLDGGCQYADFVQESIVECHNYPSCARSQMQDIQVHATNGGIYDSTVVESIIDCNVSSCGDTTILKSNLTCSSGSCEGADVDRSFVHCHDEGSCQSSFSRSAITCDSGACEGASLMECTCCDGLGCPEVDTDRRPVQSCSDATIEAFCLTLLDGLTCAEWGNPLCEATSTKNETDIVFPILSPDTCSHGLYVVTCTNNCTWEAFDNCPKVVCDSNQLDMYDLSYPCATSTFYRSVVECIGFESCWDYSVFGGTTATFVASQVDCQDEDSCGSSKFLACSCCDGEGCAENDALSCSEDPTSLCNSKYLGRSCASWGNPLCQGMDVPDPSESAIVCQHKDSTCTAMKVESAGVVCIGADCLFASFDDSMVECVDTSCTTIQSTRSEVSCSDESCTSSTFRASAVRCHDDYTCGGATFMDCSCCDGPGCDGTVPSCESICDMVESDKTCAEWGNPICTNSTIDV